MKRTTPAFFSLVALLAVGLAGCGGAGSTLSDRCNFIFPVAEPVPASLVFPVPFSTGVQTSNLQIEILNAYSSDDALFLDGGPNGSILTDHLGRTAVPPFATPPPGNAWFVTVPQLAAHTTYSVSLQVPPPPPRPDGCPTPPVRTLTPLGQFTTQ